MSDHEFRTEKTLLCFWPWYENCESKLLWKIFDVICLVVSAIVDLSYHDSWFI